MKHAILTLLLASGAAHAFDADDMIGNLGYGKAMAVYGIYGTGERNAESGNAYALRFDLAGFFGKTSLGSLAGVEFFGELGYERYGSADDEAASADFTQGPLIFDMGLGFPIALLDVGSGGIGSFRLSLAPGIGFSVQEAYAYARASLGLVVLPKALTAGLSVRYTPFDASYAWDDDTGLDTLVVQATAQWTLDEDYAVAAFVEWVDSEHGVHGDGDPASGGLDGKDPLAPVQRTPFQGLVRIGAGIAW